MIRLAAEDADPGVHGLDAKSPGGEAKLQIQRFSVSERSRQLCSRRYGFKGHGLVVDHWVAPKMRIYGFTVWV